LNIVEFNADSFQEYDGYHAIVLFCQGCNFNCFRCYNREAVSTKPVLGTPIDVLQKHVNPMHDAVVFLGGEPTVWDDDLVAAAKFADHSMNLNVKVFTNGFRPDVVKKLIDEDCVDAFSVDLKCVEDCNKILGISIQNHEYLDSVNHTLRLIVDSCLTLEIRTTELPGVDVEAVKVYISTEFPGIPHIIQKDFTDMLGPV